MKVSRFQVNLFGENTYILFDESSREGIIIDPGMYTDNEMSEIDEFIARNSLIISRVLLTHMHIDHMFGVSYLRQKYDVKVYCSEAEQPLGLKTQAQASLFGIKKEMPQVRIDTVVADGDVLTLADEQIQVLSVPGHSPGGLAFYCPSSGVVFTGDVLFDGSIGRTDLVGGDYRQLTDSIRTKLLPLPAETLVCPGHGGTTTIGDEAGFNPYLR